VQRWTVRVLSAVFALLLLAIGTLLLFACDFQTPQLFYLGRQFCPALARLGFERETARREELLASLHDAEVQLAQVPNCASPTPPPPPPPPEPPPPPPPPPPAPPPGPVVGKPGRLQITLWWFTRDDLDLYVDCPGGHINPFNAATKGPGICGDGELDVDANRNRINTVTDPKEHVVWEDDVPLGSYSVAVRPSSTNNAARIPFSVRVDYDGESKVCTGEVMWDPTNLVGYQRRVIHFTPQHPLPECSYSDEPLQVCSGANCKN
jgi:hypothetical protein